MTHETGLQIRRKDSSLNRTDGACDLIARGRRDAAKLLDQPPLLNPAHSRWLFFRVGNLLEEPPWHEKPPLEEFETLSDYSEALIDWMLDLRMSGVANGAELKSLDDFWEGEPPLLQESKGLFEDYLLSMVDWTLAVWIDINQHGSELEKKLGMQPEIKKPIPDDFETLER